MIHRIVKAAAVCVVLAAWPAGVSAEEEEHTYLVGFEENTAPSLIEDVGGETGDMWERIDAGEAILTDREAARLSSEDGIAYVEPDQDVEIQAIGDLENWGLENTQAPSAWDDNVTGADVEVAVVDTGISKSHPSLDVTDGYSAVSYTDSYNDDNGHGSHTAGIIGAYQPGMGLMGVAPDVELSAVKVLDENGSGTLSQVLSGLEWAIEQDVDVINMSFGTLTDSSSMKEMLDEAYEDGIIVTAASGNRGEGEEKDTDRVEFPARYESVIAVGAVDKKNERAYFSASGEAVELSAPGEDIVSTYKDRSYGPLSGTSMATPFVSGAFALLKEAYPEKEAPELREMLQNEAVDLGAEGRDERYGYGLLQIPDLSDAGVPEKEDFGEGNREKPVEEDIEENPVKDDPIETPEEPPEAPAGVETEVVENDDGTRDVYVFWDRSEMPVMQHRVYRDGESYGTTDNGKLFKDENVAPGTYSYEVTAVSMGEEESGRSSTVEVVIEDDRFAWPEEGSAPADFQDIHDEFWAAEAVRELQARGVIQGSGRDFRPGETVRRGQAVTMLGRVIGWSDDPASSSFSDVSRDYFASGYIADAVDAGVISGFSDGTFRPNAGVTRGQMAAMLGRAFDFSGENGGPVFRDVDASTTGAGAIAWLAEQDIVTGYDDGTFHPETTLSRAQFASILYKLGEHLKES
ncbi:S8 family peptidase [Salibacterium qingdaonense]|uniref:S8 family peptidase n=1 Tax=Salibacterium qingdaonense TaxID=266892 RepID=UPI000B80AAC7|nr:S8 family serine peptidase [Salibacterium qingdaonense]